MAPVNESVFVKQYLTPIAVLLGCAFIALALIMGGGPRSANPNAPGAEAEVDIKDVAMDAPFVGDENAPTTIVVYYDYQCPFCKAFELSAVPELMAYVASGKTKIVYKDFQFLGEDSTTAALFGRALFDLYPERFHAWFVAMMNAQDDEGDRGFGDLASVEEVTASIQGIDVSRVVARMNENRSAYEEAILANRAEGASFGVNGTPSVIVGSKLLTGLSPAGFASQIKAELDAQL